MGVSHKALVPVAGEAMVGRVLRVAAEAFPDSPLFVSVEDFKDYAANDLALFKEAFAKSAADMCTRWGAFNPFADLLPKRTD